MIILFEKMVMMAINCDNDFSLKSYSDWCLSQKGSRLQTRNVQSKMREMVVNDQDKVGFNLNGNEDKICNKIGKNDIIGNTCV